jgi:hypothetical protein
VALLLQDADISVAEALCRGIRRQSVDAMVGGRTSGGTVLRFLFPVAPLLGAFDLLSPGAPPVPIVLPFESVLPVVACKPVASLVAPTLPPAAFPAASTFSRSFSIRALNR